MKIIIRLFVIFSFLCIKQYTYSQDIEGILNEAKEVKQKIKQRFDDSLTITGGISASSEFNYITGTSRRTNPYNYQLYAELNFSMYGFSLPLSLNFSNEKLIYNYDLPAIKLPKYSLAGMSPSYKWATVHVGDRSLDFSPYTLSGHSFTGFGTELKPGNFYFGMMYGRLRRAQAEDLNSLQNLDPVYKRKGWGFKAGFDTGTDHIFAILFRGWDDPQSLTDSEEQTNPDPADNTTISLQGKKKLTERISFSVDYALSAFTPDTKTNETLDKNIFASVLGLFQPHVNSQYFSAVKSSLAFQVDIGSFSLNHEWVQPGYRTLGALFFNNDFENWTIGTNLNLFDKKLSLNTSLGIERNNLDGLEPNTALRLVGSINTTFTINEKVNINCNYSNFRNTSKLKAVSDPQLLVDSIVLSQVNQSAGITTSYTTGEEKNSTFTAMFTFNQSNSVENDTVQADQFSTNYTAGITHTYLFNSLKLAVSSAMLSNWNILPDQRLFSLSPTVSIKKSFLEDKLNATSAFSYVINYKNNNYAFSNINLQAGLEFTFKDKHQIGLRLSLVNQKNVGKIEADNANFIETSGQLTYSWKF